MTGMTIILAAIGGGVVTVAVTYVAALVWLSRNTYT